MLLGETVAIYCENRAEHMNTLCVTKQEYYYVEARGTYSYHSASAC
jgi:hypothetical protein